MANHIKGLKICTLTMNAWPQRKANSTTIYKMIKCIVYFYKSINLMTGFSFFYSVYIFVIKKFTLSRRFKYLAVIVVHSCICFLINVPSPQ